MHLGCCIRLGTTPVQLFGYANILVDYLQKGSCSASHAYATTVLQAAAQEPLVIFEGTGLFVSLMFDTAAAATAKLSCRVMC